MNFHIIVRYTLALVGALIASASLATTSVVVPNSRVDVEGETNNLSPFEGGVSRYQQVYASSQFAEINPGGAYLTQIVFRPDTFSGFPMTWRIPGVRIEFSTTSKTPHALDEFFANNIGPDKVLAFGPGPLTLSTLDSGPSSGPRAFDIVIPLTIPFFYDPVAGNLLMDVQVYSPGATISFGPTLDAVVSDPSTSRVWASDATSLSANGAARDIGLVTEFTFVPESTTGNLALVSLLTATARRCRCSRRQWRPA
jgi:hypothetical protein